MKRALLLLLAFGCGGKSVRDVIGKPSTDDAGAFADVAPAPSVRTARRDGGAGPEVTKLAKASSRAIALDADNVYFGSSDDDTMMMVPKKGGPSVRLARRAPVVGGLARDGDLLGWIATPGDVVLKMPSKGAVPLTVRDHGIFVDIAASGGEWFIAEVVPGGGAVTRIVNGGSSRIASLDVAPRALVVDGADIFVALPSKIVRYARGKTETVTVVSGTSIEAPFVTAQFMYFTQLVDNERVIARVARTGGEATTMVKRVAGAPFVVDKGEIFYFEGRRAEVRALAEAGGQPRTLATDDSFTRPNAIAVDEKSVYVAAGEREDGTITSFAR